MKKKEEILAVVESSSKPISVGEVARLARTSTVYASRTLGEWAKSGVLKSQKVGNRVYYEVIEGVVFLNRTYVTYTLREDEILELVRRNKKFSQMVGEAARSAFEFAFPEMLNNAIEHSQSDKISVMARVLRDKLEFVIRDYGVGVFRNFRKEKGLDSEYDAIREILKGRNTTVPRAHTGMGIFFTSKIADKLELNSYDLSLVVDNEERDTFVSSIDPELAGTEVRFAIDVNSKKSVSDVFRSYSVDPDEGDFDKTYIPVKLYKLGSVYVSRSQARALLAGLNKFKKITLDFDGVDNVGQAFADEIFRVFASNFPEIEIDYVNTNKNIDFMIDLAKNGLREQNSSAI